MRIALGADHAGFQLKQDVRRQLDERGIGYTDFGTDSPDSVDYPDFAQKVGDAVASGGFDRGILFCGSGIGMAIAANKIPGVRAAAVFDADAARLSREHNDANVLSMGGRIVAFGLASEILELWLATPFDGGRHERRVAQIADLERENS
jgi:ribose 5-phosphate isomerase B